MQRNERITFRCTEKEKEEIMIKANKANQTISEYALEKCIEGKISERSKKKKMVKELVKLTDLVSSGIHNESGVMDEKSKLIREGVSKLWEYL